MPCGHYPDIQEETGFKEAGQLYAKRMFDEECGKGEQFHKQEKGRPCGDDPRGLFS